MEHPVGSPHIHGQMQRGSTASPVPFTCWRTLTRVKGEHILGSSLEANGRASGPPTLLDPLCRRSPWKTGLGVWEQPGGVTEAASHTKARVMGSHAPGNTAGREAEREGGGEEAPSPMDSPAHLAGGSWCCSLLQSLCQRQDTGLAPAISSFQTSAPVFVSLGWLCCHGDPRLCPPRSCGTVPCPRGLAEPPWVPLLALGETHRARGVWAPASAAGVVWHPGPPSCTPGSEAHLAWGAGGSHTLQMSVMS